MPYFKPTFSRFFKDLAKNNNTVWFNENRKTYENEVKKPFAGLVEEMILRIQAVDPAVNIQAADAMMRINKDIRFSKDKTPYNTHVGAIISPYGRKSKEYPGMYLQLSADKIMVYGGAYMVEKANLQSIRRAIADHMPNFDKLISNKDFIQKFGSIQGEKNKVLPAEFKSVQLKQPLVANKSFYFFAEPDYKNLFSEQLPELLMDYYHAAKPLNDFLAKCISI